MTRIEFCSACVFLAVLSGLPSEQAQSQNVPLREVKSAFQFAAERAHAALVVEGEPYKKTLTAKEAEAIEAIKPDARPDELVVQVARAYDYDAERQPGTTVYVLKKRYSDPDDLPFVTLKETQAAIDDMMRVLGNFHLEETNLHISPSRAVRSFAASLSSEQLLAMKDETSGLAVSTLNPQQYDQIRRIPLFLFVQTPEAGVRKVGEQVHVVTDPTTTIGKSGQKDGPFFGYEGSTLDKKPSRFFRALNRKNSGLENDFVTTSVNGVRVPSVSEPQAEPKSTIPTASGEAAAARLSQTLREAVEQTQSRLETGTPQTTVDDELASKPVFLVNGAAAPPATILRALAHVYGLRLTTKADGSHSISRARRPQVKTIMDVPQALAELIPDPFARALHWRERVERDAQNRAEINSLLQPGAMANGRSNAADHQKARMLFQAERLRMRPGYGVSSSDVRWAAVRRLRAAVEPRLKAEAKTMVPVSTLTDAQQAALSDVLLADLWTAVQLHVVNPVPDYVTHFEDGYVTGGYGNFSGHNSFRVQFHYRNAEGKLVDSGVTTTAIIYDNP